MADRHGLTPSLKKRLKGESHRLRPLVVVGHAGLTDAVVSQVRRVLKTNELIKVRIEGDDRDAVQALAEELAVKTDAALVTRIGKVAVLYREKEEEGGNGHGRGQ